MLIPRTLQLTPPSCDLSCLKNFSSPNEHQLISRISQLSRRSPDFTCTTTIQMRGGAQKYPGGLNKYQWRRVKAVKSKKVHEASLLRESQFYGIRKRADLKSAVSELERPWEALEGSPESSSFGEDEQMKFFHHLQFPKQGGYENSEQDSKRGNGSRVLKNYLSDCESDSERETGHGNLVMRKNQVIEGNYWKNSRVGDVQEPDNNNIERILISGEKMGSLCGRFKGNEKMDSKKCVLNNEEIREITTFSARGRHQSNARQHK